MIDQPLRARLVPEIQAARQAHLARTPEAHALHEIVGAGELGTSPTLMKSMPSFAFSEATMTSNGRIMVSPMPTAAPFTAATSGFDSRQSFTQSRPAGMPPSPSAVFLPWVDAVDARLKRVGHVRAGTEATARTGHDDRPDLPIAVGLTERIGQLLRHVRRPGIQLLGAVSA